MNMNDLASVEEELEKRKLPHKPYLHWMTVDDAKTIISIICKNDKTSPNVIRSYMIDNETVLSGNVFKEKTNPYKIYNTFKFLERNGLIIKNGKDYDVKCTENRAMDVLESLEVWDQEKVKRFFSPQ